MATEDPDFYFDLSKFHATMLTTRGSFMLVFQSLLLSSLAILFGKEGLNQQVVQILLWLGLATSVVWWYLNYLTRVVEVKAWEKLLACDTRVKELADHRRDKSIGSISWLMAYPFPALLAAVWIYLLTHGGLK